MQRDSQLGKVLVGALLGAGFAFLFLTSKGHRLLNHAEPWLDDVIQDLQRLRSATAKAREAIDEGRRSFAAMSDAVPFGHQKQSDWPAEHRH